MFCEVGILHVNSEEFRIDVFEQVRKRARQTAKLSENNERSMNARLDMANAEAHAEKSWQSRLLDLLEAGSISPDVHVHFLTFFHRSSDVPMLLLAVAGLTRLSVISQHRSLCTLRRRAGVSVSGCALFDLRTFKSTICSGASGLS